jgi:hypothetical protein
MLRPTTLRLALLSFAAGLFCHAAPAQPAPTLAQVLESPTEVKAPDVAYGFGACQAQRVQVLVTPRHIVHVINFTQPKAVGNCNVSWMSGSSSLESPMGTHPVVAAYAESGESVGWAKSLKTYLVFDRRGASEADAAQAVFNANGKRLADATEYQRSSRTREGQSVDVLMAMFRLQDKARNEQLEKATSQFESAGGVPAVFATLNGRMPDVDLFKRLFAKVEPLPETACSQGVFKTLAKLMANHETSAFLFSTDLTGWSFDQAAYANAANLARMNKTPHLNYEAYTVNDNSGAGRQRGLALVVSDDCKHLYLKTEYIGGYTNRKKYGKTAFSEVLADFSGDFIRGNIKNRAFSFVTDSGLSTYRDVLPALDFICTQDKCFKGDVATVFTQGVLKSADPWAADIKPAIASLEQQRDNKLAADKREREAREAREAEQRRLADAEAAKRRDAEERAMNAALQAKDPQAMYLAAGKYEREGESYRARQVYERLIERFPSSTWAVKANDQLLQNRRVDAVNSATQRASSEAGDRAYKACRIEMDTCYSHNGKNCYRNCDGLR